MEEEFTIQQVAKMTGLSAHTLRYYERIGLLHAVNRNTNGYRRYSSADIAWIEFLTRLRKTGMPIRTMQHFAHLRNKGNETVHERRVLLEKHQNEVQNRLNDLQQNLIALEAKIQLYKRLEVQDETDD